MRLFNVGYVHRMNLRKTLEKYYLFEMFSSLEKNILPENKTFPNPINELINGARYFRINQSIALIPRPLTEKALFTFQEFAEVFIIVEKLWNKETKKGYVERIKNIKQVEQLRGFVFEIQMLFFLCIQAGFKLESIPEVTEKKKGSPPDSILSHNGQKFQVECLTFSESKGCPIIKEAAMEFKDKLTFDPLYNELCPSSHYCQIKFTFDKRLVSGQKVNCYTPVTLLEKFKGDLESSNIAIIKDVKDFFAKETMDENEASQKFSINFSPSRANTNIVHQIILHSLETNSYWQEIKNEIEKKIEKKLNNEYNYRLILCIELYDLPANQESLLLPALCWKYKEKPLLCIFTSRTPYPDSDWRKMIIEGKSIVYFISKAMEPYIKFLPKFFHKQGLRSNSAKNYRSLQ